MGKTKHSKENSASAEETIFSYIVKDYNLCGCLGSAEGQDMPKDLKDTILYESSFKKCLWEKCDLTNVSGNGCRFAACDFFKSNITNAAFQHSVFYDNVFYDTIFSGSNLAYSVFEWNALKRSDIDGCAFTGAVFSNTMIQSCVIQHSNFELCVFQDTSFADVDLSNLALKYSFFRNVKMKNVKLPFMQMPYTFGGMRFVLSQDDNIRLATTNPDKPLMKVKEYKKLLPKLIDFFKKHDDHFPLANCYLANNQRDLAKAANATGIIKSTLLCDFRKLYFFCIQASQEIKLSKEEREDIYHQISGSLQLEKLRGAEYREFRHYFPMIKRLMFDNPYNNPTLSISLHTNIAADDFKKLGLLMRVLDAVAESCGAKLDSKHLEIRHNSPNILDWFPVGELPELLNVLSNTIDTIKPFITNALPQILQNAANIATIIGAIHSFQKSKQKRNNEPLVNAITEEVDDFDANDIDAHNKIRKMRKKIEEQKVKHQRNVAIALDADLISMRENDHTVSNIIKEMESSNIKIDGLEIHILSEQSDILEHIYNSGNIV